MSKSEKKEEDKSLSENEDVKPKDKTKDLKESSEEKLKSVEEKLLRTLAEMENQRRRFEKERDEAFEFGGFSFAKESLSLLDKIDRAIDSFKNDENFNRSLLYEEIVFTA